MTEPAANYIGQNDSRYFRGKARQAWLITAGIVGAWVALMVIAPLARESGWAFSSSLYNFFSYICHQLPERSLHIAGHPMAVCSRCFGVYFGLFAGILFYPLIRPVETIDPLPRIWLILSIVPIGVDWSLTFLGIWENTHVSRVITGAILGVACAVYIVPAIVEIRYNLIFRRRTTG